MKNVMVQVIKIDRSQMNTIHKIFEPVIEKMKQFCTLVNHVNFISERSIDNKLKLINQFSFKVGIQSYSNIGRVSTFDVDLEEATVTPDEYVQQEIDFNLNGYQTSDKPNYVEDNEANDEALDPFGSNQTSAKVLDFTVERHIKDDNCSTNDHSISDEDESSFTSSDEECNPATAVSTYTAENRFLGVPDSTLFSVDTMITKTEINKILHLGSANQQKLPRESDGHKSKRKKIVSN